MEKAVEKSIVDAADTAVPFFSFKNRCFACV